MLRFAITDRHLLFHAAENAAETSWEDWRPRLIARCASLSDDGIDFILVREKDLPAGELVRLCREIAAAARATGHARILVSGRPDVALAASLDGVHLSASTGELTPGEARRILVPALAREPWISVSCHTKDEVARARENNADAILFGPVFGKSVADKLVVHPTGLEALHEASIIAAPIPVFALGGLTPATTQSCLDQGAAGIAAIRLFFAAGDSPGI